MAWAAHIDVWAIMIFLYQELLRGFKLDMSIYPPTLLHKFPT
jgi:hypothetical protein